MNVLEAGEFAMNRRAIMEQEAVELDVDAEIERVAEWLATTDEGFMSFMDYAYNRNTFTEGLDDVLRMTQEKPVRSQEDFTAIGRALCALMDDEILRVANDDWRTIKDWIED